MRADEIKTTEHALGYMVDCTLATVENMAMTKSRKKNEYKRQKSIAQKGVNWLVLNACEYHHTRVASVIGAPHYGSVESYASAIEKKFCD